MKNKTFYIFCCFLKLFITSSDFVPFPSLNTSRITPPSILFIPLSHSFYMKFLCAWWKWRNQGNTLCILLNSISIHTHTHVCERANNTKKRKRSKIVIKEDIDIHSRSIHVNTALFSIVAALVLLWVPLEILLFSSCHPFHFPPFFLNNRTRNFYSLKKVPWRETKYNAKESESASCDNNANNLF